MQRKKTLKQLFNTAVRKRGPTKLLTQAKLEVPSAFQKGMLSLLNLLQKDNYVPGKGSSTDETLAAATTTHIILIMCTYKSCEQRTPSVTQSCHVNLHLHVCY